MRSPKTNTITTILVITTILLTLIPLTTYAIPQNHYFKSIDYSDSEYIDLAGIIPRIEVAINKSNNQAVIVFTAKKGEIGITLYNVSTDSEGSLGLQNKSSNHLLIPTHAILNDNILYITAIGGDGNGYIYAVDLGSSTSPAPS